MPAYNANNLSDANDRNSQNVNNALIVAMYKGQRERLRNERRDNWISDVIKKHDMK